MERLPDTPLMRVNHFVDGRALPGRAARIHELVRHPADHGRHGVPVASPDDVAEMVARCGDGLARWMAIGVDRRREILRLASAALRDRLFELAEAYADDDSASAVETVAMSSAIIDTMLKTVEECPPSPLRPGVYVYMPSYQHAGPRFVPLLWPILLSGSTLILHPLLDKPRIGYAFASLLSDAGLPDGVMNVMYGDRDTTIALLSDPAIAGVVGVGPQHHADALTEVADALGKRWLTGLLSEPEPADA